MSRAEIGHLRAALSANSAVFEADMAKARQAVRTNAKGMEQSMNGVSQQFTKATNALKGYAALAATAAAGAFVAFVKQQIDVADKMGKLAASTGTTAEYLSSMTFVASQSGTTLEAVARATNQLAKNMADFRRGAGESREAFEDLNITVTDGNGVLRSTDSVIKEIADRFEGMEDGADKTALAMRLFGEAGAELIPMLNAGGDGIQALQDKAEEMGIVISTKTALEAAYLNDQLDILQTTAMGAGRGIALDLIPWLNESVEVVKQAYIESGTLMAAWVGLRRAAAAIWEPSTQSKIEQARAQIDALEKSVSRLQDGTAKIRFLDLGLENQKAALESWRKTLADLEAQRDREDKAEDERMQASVKRQREEAEQRRANTEAMIKQSEERMRQEQITTEEAKAEAARIKAAQDAIAAIDKQIEALEFQAETYGRTNAEITLHKLALEGASEAQLNAAYSAMQATAAMEAETAAAKKASDAAAKLKSDGEALFEKTRTDAEKYAAELERIKELLDENVISTDTYQRALRKLSPEFQALQRSGERAFDALGEAAENNFQDMGDTAKRVIREIISDLFKMAAINPLKNMLLGTSAPTLSGLSGMLGGLFSGTSSAAVSASTSMVYANPISLMPGFAGGGYTGDGPRIGGLDGMGGFMAMLHPGETVVDHAMGQGMPGGNTYMIDARGADAGAVVRIEQALIRLAGPGRVEERAIDAVRNARNRNPGMFT